MGISDLVWLLPIEPHEMHIETFFLFLLLGSDVLGNKIYIHQVTSFSVALNPIMTKANFPTDLAICF